jgi:hypothetical protein
MELDYYPKVCELPPGTVLGSKGTNVKEHENDRLITTLFSD